MPFETADTETTWFGEIAHVLEATKRAERTLGALNQWLWRNVVANDVLPRELPSEIAALLSSLCDDIETVKRDAAEAIDRYRDRAISMFLKGRILSREQYHLLAAMGFPVVSAKQAGVSEMDDYDVFCNFCYEDDKRSTYINPAEEPRQPGRVKLRFGAPPEDLAFSALRPEQLTFFKDYLPAVLARFNAVLGDDA